MVHYSNKCLKKQQQKALYKCDWFQVESCCFPAHDLSVFSFSSAPILADAATGAAETVTGTHPPLTTTTTTTPHAHTPLPAVHLEVLASACVS